MQFLQQKRNILYSVHFIAVCPKIHQYYAMISKDCGHHLVCWGLNASLLWGWWEFKLPLFWSGFSFRIIGMDQCSILCDESAKNVLSSFLVTLPKEPGGKRTCLCKGIRCVHPRNPLCRKLPHLQMVVNVFFSMVPTLIFISWANCWIGMADVVVVYGRICLSKNRRIFADVRPHFNWRCQWLTAS